MRKFIFIGLVLLVFAGCTQNERVSSFGGKSEMTIEPGMKLVNVTWNEKDDTLWYCMRPFRPGEEPETYTVTEKSAWGIFTGTYTIHETR